MGAIGRAVCVVLLLAAAAGCATSRPSGAPAPHYKVGEPYKVNGEWHYPRPDPDYDEIGMASWYGNEFHGRATANGERFDKNALTAAHKTLPLPSWVEVQNLDNGRKVVLRLNDRGPFARGRIIDVSHAAARRLGFEHEGLARVRVRYRGPADLPPGQSRSQPTQASKRSNPPERRGGTGRAGAPTPDIAEILHAIAASPAPARHESEERKPVLSASINEAPQKAPPATPLFVVQVAALSHLANIESLRAELAHIGPLRITRAESPAQSPIYRIHLGPYADSRAAAQSLEAARKAGYDDASLITISP